VKPTTYIRVVPMLERALPCPALPPLLVDVSGVTLDEA
jgi:hypothetical protein